MGLQNTEDAMMGIDGVVYKFLENLRLRNTLAFCDQVYSVDSLAC